jgi:GNAT superfamily N-acetyltransferase
MTDLVVREAEPSDQAELQRLRQILSDELSVQRGGPVLVSHEFAAPRPDAHRTTIGLLHGAAVGFTDTEIVAVDTGRLGRVRRIFVEAEAREVGVGEAMLEDAMAWCREHGAFGIDGFALPGMRATKNFYEMVGMKARLLVVHAPLT